MTKSHWKNDRDGELVLDFADDSMVIEGMKMWLGLDDTIQCNDEHVQKAFEALNDDTQIEILEAYIEYVGLEAEFDMWYERRYGDDEDEYDPDGERADREYDMYRDYDLSFKDSAFGQMGLDTDETQESWDAICKAVLG